MNFGRGPLSDAKLLEAAKQFVPVAIYNNKPGDDAKVLKRFKERAWNNPVVRFMTAEGEDLIPRKDGVYSLNDLLERLKQAQEAFAKRAVK